MRNEAESWFPWTMIVVGALMIVMIVTATTNNFEAFREAEHLSMLVMPLLVVSAGAVWALIYGVREVRAHITRRRSCTPRSRLRKLLAMIG